MSSTFPETSRFAALFLELDDSYTTQRREVTLACVEALVDRVVNPPMLDAEIPEIADVDGAERELIRLISEEADRVRAWITSHPPPPDDGQSAA